MLYPSCTGTYICIYIYTYIHWYACTYVYRLRSYRDFANWKRISRLTLSSLSIRWWPSQECLNILSYHFSLFTIKSQKINTNSKTHRRNATASNKLRSNGRRSELPDSEFILFPMRKSSVDRQYLLVFWGNTGRGLYIQLHKYSLEQPEYICKWHEQYFQTLIYLICHLRACGGRQLCSQTGGIERERENKNKMNVYYA